MYIKQNIVQPFLIENPNSQTSTKAWAANFLPVDTPIVHAPTMTALNALFGPELRDPARPPNTAVHPPHEREIVLHEPDVTRMYNKQISGVVMSALGRSQVMERSESGPLESTSFSGSVDSQFFRDSQALAIGELKSPGTIDSDWSDGSTPKSSNTLRLGRELRG